MGGSLLTSDLLDSLLGWEPDNLMKGGGDYPHVVDPRSSNDNIIGGWAIQCHEGYMEVYPIDID